MSVFYRCNACGRTIGGTEKVYEIVICCKDRSGLGDWSAIGGTVVHLCKDLPKSSGFIAKAEET